jgi:tRNA pseudouridine55 synthase
VKRLTGERRVGHAGTLDPLATGVLPICLGQGTRITEFLMDTTKAYRAQIELGVATDTYDISGKITWKGNPSMITQEQLASALAAFCGLIQQTPPMYSAVKYQGKRLYQLARAGIKVERKSRPTRILQLEIIDYKPPLVTIEVVCGKGTYIRSLAHDLGKSLGCGANLNKLTRLRCGLFDIKAAISLTQLEEAHYYGYWKRFVYPIDIVLTHWAAMVVNNATEEDIRHGRPLGCLKQHPSVLSSDSVTFCRAYTADGSFLGVLRFNLESKQWQPEKVFL